MEEWDPVTQPVLDLGSRCARDLKPYMTSTDGLQVELPRNRSLVLVTFPV